MNDPAMPSAIRLGVLGGSNSMVRNGYVSGTVSRLKAAGHEVTLSNKAVGATNSFSGLATLVKTGFAAEIDVLLVEFCLNDTESIAGSPELFPHWARAFEGLVRRALAANKRLLVVPVLLQNRKNAEHPKLSAVHAGMRRIADRYQLPVADIVDLADMRGLHPNELYRDGSHYSDPLGVDLIADCVASTILSAYAETPVRKPRNVETAIDKRNYARAKFSQDLSPYWRGGPVKIARFTNSWRDQTAPCLAPDQSLELKLSGRLLMVEFVSTANSPPLHIRFGDKEELQPTARQTFRRFGYDFLISALVPIVHGGYDIAGKDIPVSISIDQTGAYALPTPQGDEAVGTFMPPMANTGAGFHPIGLLYVGELMTL